MQQLDWNDISFDLVMVIGSACLFISQLDTHVLPIVFWMLLSVENTK